MADSHDSTANWPSRHIWQIKPFQDIFWISLAIAVLWLGYHLRTVFVPILIGLGLAYIVNPLLRFAEREWNLPRPAMIGLILGGLTTSVFAVLFFVTPVILEEVKTLSAKAPDYVDTLAGKLHSNLDEPWIAQLKKVSNGLPKDTIQLAKYAVHNTGTAFGIVSDVLSSTVYIGVSLFLIPIYFFFFAWHFNPMLSRAKEHLPNAHRDRMMKIAGKMDQAVGAFLRGRIVVMFSMMVMFSIGFWAAGVPYWFLLGSLTGLLSFVPYLAVIGCGVAIAVKWVDVSTGSDGSFSWIEVFVYPAVAYGVVQLLEGWLLTPWIQSKSMEMNPVVILIVVLIGGAVGGLYGLLLAIPIAGCGRILCQELLVPKLEHWAEDASNPKTSNQAAT